MNKQLKYISCALLLNAGAPCLAVTYVDVELQLLIDISGSINTNEYNLQLQGYQAAFESNNVQNTIINSSEGQIAVQLIMWSGQNQQTIMIDWTLIDSPDSANSFANQIAAITRPFSGMTAIGNAINYGYPLFDSNEFIGTTQVIDISGDGRRNSGVSVSSASNNAISNGINTINGIVITDDQAVIDQYYYDVINGEDPFLLSPANFDDFQTAIENKIVAEIQGTTPVNAVSIPEPNSAGLFAISTFFLCIRKRLQRLLITAS